MFCETCLTIKFTWPEPKNSNVNSDTLWDEEGKHIFHTYSSMRDLVASLQKGCVLCAQIAAAFVQNICAKASSRVYLVWAISDKDKIPPQFRAILDEEVVRQRLYWQVFHIVTVDETLAEILWEKAETYDTNTASEASFRLVRLWLSRCLKTHKQCALRISTLPEVPTRILDIEAGSHYRNLKLVSGSGRFGPYIALSHVWGRQRIIITTKANLDEHSLEIPWDHLSKTFQDAVRISRELNVQYLWIDSLCIVQDSAEDWEIESAKMGEYYRNAILTVAATRSEDGRGGCFSDSNSWLLKPCPTSNSWSRSSSGGFEFIRPSTSAITYASSASNEENLLEHRAWCFQERLLSPRLLNYSHEGLSLLCLSSYASERAPESAELAERMDTQYLRRLRDAFSKFTAMSSSKVDPESVIHSEATKNRYKEWYQLITIYSACQLTYQTDILPAIAGMAKAFQDITKDTYLSGLWENDLNQGLLWYPRNHKETFRPPSDQPLGPSWS